jgi:hypothetical protein
MRRFPVFNHTKWRTECDLPQGGDEFEVTMRAAWDVSCAVHDNRDGTYLVEYLCGNEDEYTGPTTYVVVITLQGDHIVGSPIYHAVVSDASPSWVCQRKRRLARSHKYRTKHPFDSHSLRKTA